jgi:serine protease AprX
MAAYGANARNVKRLTLSFLVLAALALVSPGAKAALPADVHPAVIAWSNENPGSDIPVLLEAADADAAARAVAAAGGTPERAFSIVPVTSATLPRESVFTLARDKAVGRVFLDAAVVSSGSGGFSDGFHATVNSYPFSIEAEKGWEQGFLGEGVAVAVVDTGISPRGHEDFKGADGNSRVVAEVEFSPNTSNLTDGYGHGTHIAGIAAGDGRLLQGKYAGVAPRANLVNVKISDDEGAATLSDLISGLEWIYQNKDAHNIRVVNLSLHSSVAISYHADPLNAAVEYLWLNGVFVVAAAGNKGTAVDAVHYAPANDPFILTVGAIDDGGTKDFADDVIASWSSRGTTQDGFAKPELYAPGRNIVSVIDKNSKLYKENPGRIVDEDYFSLSGTSMAAGVMSGAAALVIQARPDWTPGQVKCTLIATSRALSGPEMGYVARVGQAISSSSPACDSDTGLMKSGRFNAMLKVGAVAYVLGASEPNAAAESINLDLNAAGLANTNLSNVRWDVINWDAIKWSAIKWGSVKWDVINWDAVQWDIINWSLLDDTGVDTAAVQWSAIKWSAIKWSAIKWSAIKWSSVEFNAIKWSGIKWGMVEGH